MADPLVTVARFRALPEALLAQGKLESMGITSFLADTEVAGAHWIGSLRLQVSSQDAQEALAVLQEPPPESFLAEES